MAPVNGEYPKRHVTRSEQGNYLITWTQPESNVDVHHYELEFTIVGLPWKKIFTVMAGEPMEFNMGWSGIWEHIPQYGSMDIDLSAVSNCGGKATVYVGHVCDEEIYAAALTSA